MSSLGPVKAACEVSAQPVPAIRPLVDVHNEWDPLEEVIVGVATGARIPRASKGLFVLEYFEQHERIEDIPSGPYDPRILEETEEDLEVLVAVLQGEGVTVRRPEAIPPANVFGSPEWQSDGEYNFCPRDVLLAIGNTVIEVPMPLRSRYFESLAYKDILVDYFESGAQWISAPKPRLLDSVYGDEPATGVRLHDHEPLFDAANVLRCGRDILYLVSCSANLLGARWLQRVLGDEYRVNPLIGVYDGTHLDTTITLLGPGRVMLNPERVSGANMPALFKNWDVVWCPEMIDTCSSWAYRRASIWCGMNFFMLKPDVAVVDVQQKPLIRTLKGLGIDSIPVSMRHSLTLSGGLHCVTLDVRRRGSLEDYS